MRLRLPWATLALTVLTTTVSLAITLTHQEEWAMFAMGFIPTRLNAAPPAALGMVPAILSPLSATLVHSGYMHLFSNMMMLILTGSFTERALGWQRTLLVYAAGAYAAALAQWAGAPYGLDPMVGASGAIAACIGAQCALYGPIRARKIGSFRPRPVQILWQIVAWTVLNVLGAIAARANGFPIAWAAHIGGFVVGIVMARPLLFIRLRASRIRRAAARRV
jgi:membrane associated rhomboid family serine protease